MLNLIAAAVSAHNAALCIHDMIEGHPRHFTSPGHTWVVQHCVDEIFDW
jgi:hypothetical protein